jgi:hypothetical protein
VSTQQRQVAETAEVRAELERALGEHDGQPVSVVAFGRRPGAYRTSYAIEELDVELADGRRLRLMLKDLSRASLHP